MSQNRSPENDPPTGRVAGIDFGTVRIGIAISDPSRQFASPLENYTRKTSAADADRFRRLVAEEEVTLFVVGLPVHMSGDESQKSLEARAFGDWLHAETRIPVTYFDERMTTAMAQQILGQAKLSKKRRKERMDMLAAQILLSTFLESGCRGHDDVGSIED